MKWICTLLWLMVVTGWAQAQCKGVFVKNLQDERLHSLETINNTIITRVDFDYSIRFQNSEEGITDVVTTTGIAFSLIRPLEKDDKLMFISADGTKRPYDFIYDSEKTKVNNRAAYINTVQLDLDAIEWLANNDIRQIRMVNMVEKKMYPYSLDAQRKQELMRTLRCFLQELDPSKVKDRKVAGSMDALVKNNSNPPPSSSGKPKSSNNSAAAVIARTSGSPCDQLTDEEEKALKRELTLRKDALRNEIADVRAQNDKIKARLAKDVARAKENAATTQSEIAQQVLDARKRANIEIEQAREEVRKSIEEAKKTAASISEKAQLEALSVKQKSQKKIQEIQQEEAEKVASPTSCCGKSSRGQCTVSNGQGSIQCGDPNHQRNSF